MNWQQQLQAQFNQVFLGSGAGTIPFTAAYLRDLIRHWRVAVIMKRETFLMPRNGNHPILFDELLVGYARYLIEFMQGELMKSKELTKPLISDRELADPAAHIL